MNDNAAKLGLGVHLGDRISTFLISLMERVMAPRPAGRGRGSGKGGAGGEDGAVGSWTGGWTLANLTGGLVGANSDSDAADKSPAADGAEGGAEAANNAELTQEQRQLRDTLAWTKLGLRTVCTSIGMFISWKLKDMAAIWSCCHWGGVKVARALFNVLKHEDEALCEVAGLAVAWYGFVFHLKNFNKPNLPLPMAMALGPLKLFEGMLRTMVMRSAVVSA